MELLILAVLALFAGGGRRSSGSSDVDDDGRELDPNDPPATGDDMSNPGSPKVRLWKQLEALPLDANQRLFLMLVAKGESNFVPSAFNDSAGEAAAAGRAYDRIADRLAACGRPRSAYATGSGGRFGRLVPYFANDLRTLVPCINPTSIGDGVHDLMSAIINARALQQYSSWRGTAGSLRAGWATPGWMDAPPPDKLAKWQRHAVEEDLDKGSTNFGVNSRVSMFPGPNQWPSMLATLRQLG